MTEQERHRKPFAEVARTSLIRPLQILVTEPIVLLFSVSQLFFLCITMGQEN